jgi:hypothetical protein
MKTAIQELFSQLAIEQPGLFNVNTLAGREFINNYYKFFELEKQQIIDAYSEGDINGIMNNEKRAVQYYNQTFKIREIPNIKEEFLTKIK